MLNPNVLFSIIDMTGFPLLRGLGMFQALEAAKIVANALGEVVVVWSDTDHDVCRFVFPDVADMAAELDEVVS